MSNPRSGCLINQTWQINAAILNLVVESPLPLPSEHYAGLTRVIQAIENFIADIHESETAVCVSCGLVVSGSWLESEEDLMSGMCNTCLNGPLPGGDSDE